MLVYSIYVVKKNGSVIAKFYSFDPVDDNGALERLRPLLNINWDDYYCHVSRSQIEFNEIASSDEPIDK